MDNFRDTYIDYLPTELKELLSLYYYGNVLIFCININSDNTVLIEIELQLSNNYIIFDILVELSSLNNFVNNYTNSPNNPNETYRLVHCENKEFVIEYINGKVEITNYTKNNFQRIMLESNTSTLFIQKLTRLTRDVNTLGGNIRIDNVY